MMDNRDLWVATMATAAYRRQAATAVTFGDGNREDSKSKENDNNNNDAIVNTNSSETTDEEFDPEKPKKNAKPVTWSDFFAGLMKLSNRMTPLYPPGVDKEKIRACFIIATTYLSSLTDLRKYMSLRYFYEDNLEFEVGYMTSEIIAKYQRMLEFFYMADTYYFKYFQSKNYAPPSYMLYWYTNVLEMGTVIGHLCNMMTELEEKFENLAKHKQTGFEDYHILKQSKFSVNSTAEFEKSMNEYQKRLQQEQRRRERERKKLRKKNLFAGYKPTTPYRFPKKPKPKGGWPLDYGWSIEHSLW